MESVRQERQQDAARILLNHRRFVGDIRRIIGGMDAQDMVLGLQGPAKLVRTITRAPGNDDDLDLRIGKQFFQIGDALDSQAPLPEPLQARGWSVIGRQLMAARRHHGMSHVEAVGMVANKCKAHQRVVRIPLWGSIRLS